MQQLVGQFRLVGRVVPVEDQPAISDDIPRALRSTAKTRRCSRQPGRSREDSTGRTVGAQTLSSRREPVYRGCHCRSPRPPGGPGTRRECHRIPRSHAACAAWRERWFSAMGPQPQRPRRDGGSRRECHQQASGHESHAKDIPRQPGARRRPYSWLWARFFASYPRYARILTSSIIIDTISASGNVRPVVKSCRRRRRPVAIIGR